MKYSILVPVYNMEKYLPQCIESVLAQQVTDFELILTNDGSTDGSPEICRRYAEKDARIIYQSKENEGLLLTRRYALKAARGEYVLFLDSDDFWEPNLLKEVDKAIEETHADLVLFRYKRIRDSGELVRAETGVFPDRTLFSAQVKEKFMQTFVSSILLNSIWSKAAKRSIIDIDADYSRFQDKKGEDLLQSMALLRNASSIYYLDTPLYNYRLSASGRGRNFKWKYCLDYEAVRAYVLEQLKLMRVSEKTLHCFFVAYMDYLLSFSRSITAISRDYPEYRQHMEEIKAFPTYRLAQPQIRSGELREFSRFSHFCIHHGLTWLLYARCKVSKITRKLLGHS